MVGIGRSRVFKLAVALSLAAVTLAVLFGAALAQDYSFQVNSNLVSVYVQEDSSLDIVYDITFTNDPGAHIIDIVDIGLPNDYYDLSSARATIDGNPVSGIYKSEWLDTGGDPSWQLRHHAGRDWNCAPGDQQPAHGLSGRPG